jgi:PRTRC genetic system protein B
MGQRWQEALRETPQLTLSFYSYGILLRQVDAHGTCVEYAVDANQVAQALSAKVVFDTGLLDEGVLWVRRDGLHELTVSFRKAQKTGIWLEGSAEPLRVPLPPLVLIRHLKANKPQHLLFAVKARPTSADTPLFHAPLPNVYPSGSICWGNIRLNVEPESALSADWNLLLGSPFGNHSVGGKSQHFQMDIRQQLLALAQANARIYPKQDLIPVHKTLRQLLNKESDDV